MEKQSENLRAYFFANMYLPSLHAGIQSQHTTAEMFVKYAKPNTIFFNKDDEVQRGILFKQASDHKTTIVLNGGMSGDLAEIKSLLSHTDNPYPWAYFNETEYALNGALTNVGVILPERIYSYHKLTEDEQGLVKLSDFEQKLVEILSTKQLMW